MVVVVVVVVAVVLMLPPPPATTKSKDLHCRARDRRQGFYVDDDVNVGDVDRDVPLKRDTQCMEHQHHRKHAM